MLFKKITEGHVVQVFNDAGELLGQRFVAGDNVEYETGDGDPINVVNMPKGGDEYHPFDMVQPYYVRQGVQNKTHNPETSIAIAEALQMPVEEFSLIIIEQTTPIKVRCRTNLDLSYEEWPTELPALPKVGDHIASKTKHGHFRLELAVCRVTWEYSEFDKEYLPIIELHMTSFHRGLPVRSSKTAETGSIVAFYDWYAPLVGRTPSAFI